MIYRCDVLFERNAVKNRVLLNEDTMDDEMKNANIARC